MAGPSFPPSLGGGPAVPPGNTILPAICSPNNEGWDFLVRRIEDQRSKLDRKEKELGELQDTLAIMAEEKARLITSQGAEVATLQGLLVTTRWHAL